SSTRSANDKCLYESMLQSSTIRQGVALQICGRPLLLTETTTEACSDLSLGSMSINCPLQNIGKQSDRQTKTLLMGNSGQLT
ncbi:MAG: hypothetical protein SGI99_12265, partial [Pseudomonadota bacterium]|nr:hypothetical protein [Pseudomonadota bacterium]